MVSVSRVCNLRSTSQLALERHRHRLTYCRAMGMRPIVIDGGDKKCELTTSMGAEAFVDFTKEKDVAAKVKEIADGVGAHGVLVTAYQAYKGAH